MYQKAFVCLVVVGLGIAEAQTPPIKAVATTTFIADIARRIGGPDAAVDVLIPPGSDPHAFELSPQDLARLTRADLIFANGLGLETFLEKAFVAAHADREGRLVVVSEGRKPREICPTGHPVENETHHHVAPGGEDAHRPASKSERPEGEWGTLTERASNEHEDTPHPAHAASGPSKAHTAGHPASPYPHGHDHHHEVDPHVWFDPSWVQLWATNIAEAFARRDPARAENYRSRAKELQLSLERLNVEIRTLFEGIPAERRVLVTDHDEFGYLADRYGIRVLGAILPNVTTVTDVSARELAALARRMRAEGARVIVVGHTANPALAEQLARDVGGRVVRIRTHGLAEGESYEDFMRRLARELAHAMSDTP